MSRGRKANIGDTRTALNGYHYTRTASGWESTHRLVLQKKLGRPISTAERVRFLDGDRGNLDPENLEVYKVREASTQTKIARLEVKKDEIMSELLELYKEAGDNIQAELIRRAML